MSLFFLAYGFLFAISGVLVCFLALTPNLKQNIKAAHLKRKQQKKGGGVRSECYARIFAQQ